MQTITDYYYFDIAEDRKNISICRIAKKLISIKCEYRVRVLLPTIRKYTKSEFSSGSIGLRLLAGTKTKRLNLSRRNIRL